MIQNKKIRTSHQTLTDFLVSNEIKHEQLYENEFRGYLDSYDFWGFLVCPPEFTECYRIYNNDVAFVHVLRDGFYYQFAEGLGLFPFCGSTKELKQILYLLKIHNHTGLFSKIKRFFQWLTG